MILIFLWKVKHWVIIHGFRSVHRFNYFDFYEYFLCFVWFSIFVLCFERLFFISRCSWDCLGIFFVVLLKTLVFYCDEKFYTTRKVFQHFSYTDVSFRWENWRIYEILESFQCLGGNEVLFRGLRSRLLD